MTLLWRAHGPVECKPLNENARYEFGSREEIHTRSCAHCVLIVCPVLLRPTLGKAHLRFYTSFHVDIGRLHKFGGLSHKINVERGVPQCKPDSDFGNVGADVELDIIGEAITYFKANVFFSTFEIKVCPSHHRGTTLTLLAPQQSQILGIQGRGHATIPASSLGAGRAGGGSRAMRIGCCFTSRSTFTSASPG